MSTDRNMNEVVQLLMDLDYLLTVEAGIDGETHMQVRAMHEDLRHQKGEEVQVDVGGDYIQDGRYHHYRYHPLSEC